MDARSCMNLRLPHDLKQEVRDAAERNGTTITAEIENALRRYLLTPEEVELRQRMRDAAGIADGRQS